MNGNHKTPADPDALLEQFAAALTSAAYGVARWHGTAGTWLDLELDLWRALTETVKQWAWNLPPHSQRNTDIDPHASDMQEPSARVVEKVHCAAVAGLNSREEPHDVLTLKKEYRPMR